MHPIKKEVNFKENLNPKSIFKKSLNNKDILIRGRDKNKNLEINKNLKTNLDKKKSQKKDKKGEEDPAQVQAQIRVQALPLILLHLLHLLRIKDDLEIERIGILDEIISIEAVKDKDLMIKETKVKEKISEARIIGKGMINTIIVIKTERIENKAVTVAEVERINHTIVVDEAVLFITNRIE